MANFEYIIDSTTLVGFHGNPEIAEVIEIPPGVIRIGDHAFDGLPNLKRVLLPNSTVEIGNYSFADCWELEYVRLPSNLIKIGDGAFKDAHSLSSIDLPQQSLTYIGQDAFAFSGLKAIVFPGIEVIKEGTCGFCNRLERVWLNSGTRVVEAAFYGCSSMTYLRLADTVEKFRSFSNDDELSKRLGYKLHAFSFCQSLTTIDISPTWKESHEYMLLRIRKMVERAADECAAPRVYDHVKKWNLSESKMAMPPKIVSPQNEHEQTSPHQDVTKYASYNNRPL